MSTTPDYYTDPSQQQTPASNTEIYLMQLVQEQAANRRCLNAITAQLKKDAEERERTYGPVRLLCWVQIVCMAICAFCLFLSFFVGIRS